jgi:hypothetical protein
LRENGNLSPKIAENVDHNIDPRDRCYDFKNIFAEKFRDKIGVFDSKQS